MVDKNDIGQLILRLALALVMLPHGISKLIGGHDFIKAVLTSSGLPQFLWLGVPIGEVIAPLFLALGIFVRPAAIIYAFNMFMSIFLVFRTQLFKLNEYGGIAYELNLLMMLGAISIFLMGGGRIALLSLKPSNKE